MREILFRGKRLDNNAWVEGFLVQAIGGGFWIDCSHTAKVPLIYFVDPSTVGQYTGLTDKNGVKIFEGDVVDLFCLKGNVVQECGAFGIGFGRTIDYALLESKIPYNNTPFFAYNDNFISLWEIFWNYEQDDNPLYEVEVIGNIHDNPELLEEG